jgi:TM2 domain-containing membrane protein YozV
MATTGFGRKGVTQSDPADGEIARLREAFIASERARRAEEGELPENGYHGAGVAATIPRAHRASRSSKTASHTEKSLFLAYILWFFACVLSAHRFYLGAYGSAVAQAGTFLGGLLMLMFVASTTHADGWGFIAAGAMAIASIWMLADVFLLPGMHRRANASARDVSATFE